MIDQARTRLIRHGGLAVLLAVMTVAAAPISRAQAPPPAPANQRLATPQSEATSPAETTFNPFIEYIRSPSGLYFPDPRAVPEPNRYGDWAVDSTLALGGLSSGGSSGAAGFIQYGDWDDGVVADFYVRAANDTTGQYLRLSAGSVGRDDQFVRLDGGELGRIRLSAFADSTPSVTATNARVLWTGAGTDSLSLPVGLIPGNSTFADVATAFNDIRDSRLAIDRDSYGLSVRFTPNSRTSIAAMATTEGRDGARAFGGAMNFPLTGGYAETVAPIDHATTNLATSLQYAGTRHLFNVSLAASFFRNDEASLTWENPGLALGFFSFQPAEGRFALPPDNDYLNFKADYATRLEFWRSRLTLTGAYSRSTQDDTLLPPAVGAGIAPGPIPVALEEWNTAAGLSKSSADAELGQWLGRIQLTMQPARRLSLLARLQATDQDNDTEYTALNPLNGLYGYVPLDGAISLVTPAGLFDPANPVARVRIRNIPYETDTLTGTLEAGIPLGAKSRLAVAYEREEKQYAFRERDETEDDSLELTYTRRGAGSLRLRYRYTERGGSGYRDDYLVPFLSSSLPAYQPAFAGGDRPFELAELRRYDLADRSTRLADVKFIVVPVDRLDVTLSGRWSEHDYDASYGLRDTSTWTANIDASLQLGFDSSVYAYYSFQNTERDVANIKPAAVTSPDASAGGPNYPLANSWSETADEDNHALGVGFRRTFGDIEFDIGYSYADGVATLAYDFSTPAAYESFQALDPDEVGSGFPDMIFRHQLLEAKIRWQMRDRIALRLYYRHEQEDIDDFHYDALRNILAPLPGAGDAYLGAVPEDYSANVVVAQIEIGL